MNQLCLIGNPVFFFIYVREERSESWKDLTLVVVVVEQNSRNGIPMEYPCTKYAKKVGVWRNLKMRS